MAEVFEWDLVDPYSRSVQGTYSVYANCLPFSRSPHWGFQTEDKFYDFVSHGWHSFYINPRYNNQNQKNHAVPQSSG